MTSETNGLKARTRRPGVFAWLRLARAHQKLERAAAADLRESGLSVPQFDVLAHIAGAESRGITQQQLAESRVTTKGNLSQLLASMEADGLLWREREGRLKRVALTPKGRALFEGVVPGHEAFMERQFDCMSAGDVATLTRLLRKLDRSMR
ncbi:MarR family transcriptional regulator [bacterium]|nr:MarR family transcriptional regulator [bacterium]